MGADFIEQDVVLTKDGIPVVVHDIFLETTTNIEAKFAARNRKDGHFYAIDFSLDEIKQLNVRERTDTAGNRIYSGRFDRSSGISLQIPTLAEEIELILGLNRSTGRTSGLYIELKEPGFHQDAGHSIIDAVVGILKLYGLHFARDLVFLQCFDADTLRELSRRDDVSLPLIQLLSINENVGETFKENLTTEHNIAKIAHYAEGIGPSIPSLFNGEGDASIIVRTARECGLLIHTYTLRDDDTPVPANSARDLHHLLFEKIKVDGVFTDFPDRTREAIKSILKVD